jgi:hypothetical protein
VKRETWSADVPQRNLNPPIHESINTSIRYSAGLFVAKGSKGAYKSFAMLRRQPVLTPATRSWAWWKFAAAVVLALAWHVTAASAGGTNLVQNGGFEQGGADWVFSVNAANASGGVVSGEAHEGTNAFRISNSSGFAPNVFGRVTQWVRGLEPFTTYRIGCFAKGTNAGLCWIGGGPGWYLRAAFPKGTFGWTNIAIEYATGEDPPDLELMVATESETAAVWVDDVRLEAVKADAARRDAVLHRLGTQRQDLRERFAALRDRAQHISGARPDAIAELGFAIVDRYLKRTEEGVGNTLQGGAWTRLQLDELPVVLDQTERRLDALSKSGKPPRRQPWPAAGPARVRDGLFYAKIKSGPEQPFWFYGYGHFIQVIRDLPNFRRLGASLIQDSQVGPSSMNADGSLGAGAAQLFKDLQAARRDGMRVDWLLSPHYFPEWALAQAPDARGGGPGFIAFDIDHPMAREVLEKFTGEMTEELKDEPALFTVCLSNEPTYDQSGRTKWGRAAFAQYLEGVHGEIGRLNELYGTHYGSFADVPPPPIGLQGTVNANRAYYDWVRFNQQHFAAWHAWLNSLVKQKLPHTPTHAKAMVFFCLDRDKLHFGVDPEMFCDATDLAGCDAYAFPNGEKTYDWIGQEFFYDLLHSFRRQPVFNSENHVIPDGAAPDHIPWQVSRAQYWQGGLHHQGATTTWVWEEAGDSSLAGSIYFRPANVYGAGRAMLDLNRFAGEAAAINRLPPRVALLYSPPSIFWEDAYKGTMLSCYRQLNFLGEPIDFISERQLAQGRMPTNEWIVAPAATHVADATAKALRRFVEAGGHLAAAGTNNFAWDEYHRARASGEIPRAMQLPALKSEQESAAALRETLAGGGVELGRVNDAVTGEPVWGVEFRRAAHAGKQVLAMMAMDGQSRAVRVPELKSAAVVDLLSGERIDPDQVPLEPMTPRLLEAQ